MTFDYENIRDSVVGPQVANFGQDATLVQPTAPTGPEYDPTPGIPTQIAVKVLKTAFTAADRAGTLVRDEDLKFLMSTDGSLLPDLESTLVVQGVTYQIYKVAPLSPGATVVLWYLYCRK